MMAILTGCSPPNQGDPNNIAKNTDDTQSIMLSATHGQDNQNPLMSSKKISSEPDTESEIPYLNDPNVLSTAKTFYVSPDDRTKFAEAARNGDGDAAFKFAQFYGLSVKNPERERYWLRVSASNGHPVGQFNLAYALINWGTSAGEKEEGMQLMRKYADNGNLNAISTLHWLEKQKETSEQK
jgi:TPR repeat protein